MGRRFQRAGGNVLHAVPVLLPPSQLLHPHLALRVDELRTFPASVVHEPGGMVAAAEICEAKGVAS